MLQAADFDCGWQVDGGGKGSAKDSAVKTILQPRLARGVLGYPNRAVSCVIPDQVIL